MREVKFTATKQEFKEIMSFINNNLSKFEIISTPIIDSDKNYTMIIQFTDDEYNKFMKFANKSDIDVEEEKKEKVSVIKKIFKKWW